MSYIFYTEDLKNTGKYLRLNLKLFILYTE